MSHKRTSTDPHFPVAHIRTTAGYMNDPNGPIWHRGRLHMFFQYNPATPPRPGKVVWGHCSSPDLVTWELHGVALAPSGDHPVTDEFWSGNTVEADGRLVAFYSAQSGADPYQLPRMTVSDDGGFSFSGDWATVPRPDASDVVVFRDPFVWAEGKGWRMLVGSGSTTGAAQVLLYESEDLSGWQPLGPFASLKGWPDSPDDLGSVWECPQYAWDLGVLFVAAWRPETGPISVQALKGSESQARFVVQGVERADYGPDFYAPSLMRMPDGRYLLWGWVWEARDQQWRDEAGWAGMISLPREVSLESGYLALRPPLELDGLRAQLCCEHAGGPGEASLGEVPRAFELWLRLEGTSPRATLTLDLGPGEELVLEVDAEAGRVVVDRDRASADPRADRGTTVMSPPSWQGTGPVQLRWFVDHSVSELFLAERAVATTRFYPVSEGPWRLRVEATGATGVEARVWRTRPSVSQVTEPGGASL